MHLSGVFMKGLEDLEFRKAEIQTERALCRPRQAGWKIMACLC